MYYPYLRGRQFELIALREFAQEYKDNKSIIPIIEPVKETFNSIKIALKIFDESNQKFALILNPQNGELINKSSNLIDGLDDELHDQDKWIPAFIVTNNYSEVLDFINDYNDVMLICTNRADSSNQEFQDLILSEKIKYLVFGENRTLKRFLKEKGKTLIRLDDNFEAQLRSSDYLTIPEKKFTEEHMYYKEDGYDGFSDYTVLISDYKTGGTRPYAISIHLTYKKENNEIWIKHFTSIHNDDQSNVQGKFAEAAQKAVEFFDQIKVRNNAINELDYYFKNIKYPGLGMVKKISIKNHLELLYEIISKPD